jgi:hypothetical protein
MSRRVVFGVVSVCFTLSGSVVTSVQAVCDSSPPVLTSFSLGPATVDTTLSSQTVTCSATATDDLAGVSSFVCEIQPPTIAGDNFIVPHCVATAPSSGTARNGTWSCVITLPRYSPSGPWTVVFARLSDATGNQLTEGGTQLTSLGYPATVSVTSDPDTAPPVQTAIALSASALDVSSGPQNLTCNMTVTDNKAGVLASQCAVFSPSQAQELFCLATSPSSGTVNNGVFSCGVTIPRYAEAGTWRSQGAGEDLAFNGQTSAGPPLTSVNVTSVPSDIDPPSLTSFAFAPTSISVGTGPRQVNCMMVVTDATSGVASAECTVSSPANNASASCTATSPSSGTRANGTFECTLSIPQYEQATSATWDVEIADLAGNSISLLQSDTLAIDCAAGDAETTCRFSANHQTLTWDAMAGATQYDVYRGPMTNLVDANADKLPDGGYGTCQNSRDPNLTDTAFVDTDVPTAAQKGFFYLVAYKTGGVEHGLGANSFGTARPESSPCP